MRASAPPAYNPQVVQQAAPVVQQAAPIVAAPVVAAQYQQPSGREAARMSVKRPTRPVAFGCATLACVTALVWVVFLLSSGHDIICSLLTPTAGSDECGVGCTYVAAQANSSVPAHCISSESDAGASGSSTPSPPPGPHAFCSGGQAGFDVVCDPESGTTLVPGSATVEKGSTALEHQTNCCAGPLGAGEVCGGGDGWCQKGLFCNEDNGWLTSDVCTPCPCGAGVGCGLATDGDDGIPALPCGALNPLGAECGHELGGCMDGLYCAEPWLDILWAEGECKSASSLFASDESWLADDGHEGWGWWVVVVLVMICVGCLVMACAEAEAATSQGRQLRRRR